MIYKVFYEKYEPKPAKPGDLPDICAYKEVRIRSGQKLDIPLDIRFELPINYKAIIVPRSSTFDKYGILMRNGQGIIDPSFNYRQAAFRAFAADRFPSEIIIPAGARIAQFYVIKFDINNAVIEQSSKEELDELAKNSKKGFGSTGD